MAVKRTGATVAGMELEERRARIPTLFDDDTPRVRDTGRKVPHPRTCGACRGAGCPIVEYVGDARASMEGDR